jgi:hypothetical protein
LLIIIQTYPFIANSNYPVHQKSKESRNLTFQVLLINNKLLKKLFKNSGSNRDMTKGNSLIRIA